MSASDGSITDGDMSIHNAGSGRRSRFLDGSIALGERVSLEVELGRLYGGDSPTGFMQFGDGSGTRGRTYLTAGARVAVGKLRLWR